MKKAINNLKVSDLFLSSKESEFVVSVIEVRQWLLKLQQFFLSLESSVKILGLFSF